MSIFPKIFKFFCVVCLLALPLSLFAGDEEVSGLIVRANEKPYSQMTSQVPIFRAQLAKIIDLHDELKGVATSLDQVKSDLALQKEDLAAIRSVMHDESGGFILAQCKEILYYLVFVVCFIWGSVLHISFIQRR